MKTKMNRTCRIANILCLLIIYQSVLLASGLSSNSPNTIKGNKSESSLKSYALDRRSLMNKTFSVMSFIHMASLNVDPAIARYILNDDGDYEEVEDEEWQTAWRQRLEKASSMSKDDIFNAARGAGNLNLKEGEESDASKKRRAMSSCRNPALRKLVGNMDEKKCIERVIGGDFDFILSSK